MKTGKNAVDTVLDFAQLFTEAQAVLNPAKTYNLKVYSKAPPQDAPVYAVRFKDAQALDMGAFVLMQGEQNKAVGLVKAGPVKKMTTATCRDAYGQLARKALTYEPETLTLYVDGWVDPWAAGVGIALGLLQPGVYKTARSPAHYAGPKKLIVVLEPGLSKSEKAFRDGFEYGGLLNLQRWLGVQAPNMLTVEAFARLAQALVRDAGGKKDTVFQPSAAELSCMGLLQAICQASGESPRVVAIRVKPKDRTTDNKVRVIVGKGIVMDTGGVSLKTPSDFMLTMNADMMGAAASLCAAIYFLWHPEELAQETVFALSIAVNNIGAKAYRPEDVIEGFNGHSVRVTNTDAEGRLALADATAWLCERFGTRVGRVTNIATLTGATRQILGNGMSAVMVRENVLELLTAAETEGAYYLDPANRFYMVDGDPKAMTDDRADLRNTAAVPQRGPQTAAAFVFAHVPEAVPEAYHLDIPGASSHDGNEGAGLAKGLPLGGGVGLLIGLHRKLWEKPAEKKAKKK